MGLDLNGNKLYKTTIGPNGEVVKNIVNSGLIAYLDAGNKNSYSGTGTTWNDLSGRGNNFTLNNITFSNNYITLNGTNSYASISNLSLTTGFTMEIWTYMSSTSGGFGLFGQGTYGTGTGLHIFYDAGSRGMIYGMYSNDNDYNENYRPSTGQWYNWIFTYNGSSYAKRFYANSVLKTPGSSVQTAYSGTGQFNIGAIYGGPAGAYANGRISQVRIYNRPLSEAEVIQNYNADKSRFGL